MKHKTHAPGTTPSAAATFAPAPLPPAASTPSASPVSATTPAVVRRIGGDPVRRVRRELLEDVHQSVTPNRKVLGFPHDLEEAVFQRERLDRAGFYIGLRK